MVLTLQLFGGLIVMAALLQALGGLVAQFAGARRSRVMEDRKLALFDRQADILIKRAEADRERSELTWAGKRKFRIDERRIVNKAGDICSFYLAPHDGGALPPFLPGQFLTFELNIPDRPAPVVRCYSLSDSPLERDRYRVSIKRLGPPPKAEPGTPGGLVSNFFHQNLKVGDVVDVMAPNGGFHLDIHSERPAVLIGGGVGLTPVLSMMKWLAGTDNHRETWFFYGVRNSNDIALVDEIREATENKSHFHSVIVYSEPSDECVEGKDYDVKGHISVEAMKRYLKSSNYEFYICGPPPMMEAITRQLLDWGVPEDDIRFEAFGPASVKKVNRAEHPESGDAGGAKVEFARSGKTVAWSAEAGSLLELADANGVRISSGCRAGNCGTCSTALKQGKVSYLAKPSSKPAQGSALVCIACPDGDIVLDA